MSTAIVMILAGSLGAAIVAFYRTVARMEKSHYRYRLWKIHDEVFDAILEGAFHEPECAHRMLREIRVRVEITDRLTPIHIIATERVLRRAGHEHPGNRVHEQASEADRKRLAAIERRLDVATFRRVFLGSISGWLLLGMFFPLIARNAWSRRRDDGGVRGLWKKELRDGTPETFTPDPECLDALREVSSNHPIPAYS